MSLASLEPWKNLQLDEIHHPIFQKYMKIIFLTIFFIECFVFPFTVFIIQTQSTKEMGNYKYLLIYHLSCAFIYRICVFIFEPVFLFPFPIVYCNSFFNIGTEFLFHYFSFALSTFIAAMHALLISFAYRAGITFIDGPIHRFFNNHFLLVTSNFIGVSIVIALFIFPILYSANDTRTLQALFTADVPVLGQIFQLYPISSGFHPKYATKMLKLFLYDGIGAVVFLPLAFIVIHITFTYRIKILEKQLSSSTYKLHLMLYRALTIQLAATTVLFFIPLGLFVSTYLLQLKDGSIYANFIMAVGGTEMIANASIILYFIKPYKNFVLKMFKKGFPFKRRNVIFEVSKSIVAITRIN